MGHGITSVLLVALGGALGGIGRFAISNAMAHALGKAFPWGTLCVNASGTLLAGWLLGVYGVANTQCKALAVHLPPDLAHTVNAEILGKDAHDLGLQILIAPGTI